MIEEFKEPVELQEWYDIGAEIRVNIRMQFSKIKRKHQEEIKDLQAKLETAREALKFNVSKHNQWIDQGHWCDSKKVLQSIVDSSRQALKEIESSP